MSIQQALAIEVERETQNTLRMIEVIPSEKLDYKPHPKSMSLGELASHIVELHGWMGHVLNSNDFNFHTDYVPFKASSSEELSASLKANQQFNETALANFTEENYFSEWTLRAGEHVIAKLPKAGAIRFIVNNHLIHHRGQLSVYLRMLDVPLPGIYGPSADEKQF
ncbi:MAG: damage-inducible protein DinB [Pedobacter sp.]|nr:MAG: damage-inducible protein DinB [Pedobacter sp.]